MAAFWFRLRAGFWKIVGRFGNWLKGRMEQVIIEGNHLSMFGKFERFTAGVCLAIPFFLLIADLEGEKRQPLLYIIPIAIIILMQFIILLPPFRPEAETRK